MWLYIVVCECSQRVQLEKGGKKCNHILSRNSFWRFHILVNRKNPIYLKLYKSVETRVYRNMNDQSKRIQTHCEPTVARSENKAGRPSTLQDFSCYHSVEWRRAKLVLLMLFWQKYVFGKEMDKRLWNIDVVWMSSRKDSWGHKVGFQVIS